MTAIPDSPKKINKTDYPSVGISKHPLYPVWRRIIYRCYAKTGKRYAEWGGRGIRVADVFLNNFYAFVEEIGPRPSLKHSIDRIDNNGDYAPGNIRWATARQQTINSSHAVMLTYNGKTQCLKDWADELGFSYKCITKRWQTGKTVEEILLPPSKKPLREPKPRGWIYEGRFWCYKELAERFGIPVTSMKARNDKGWDVERAISQPVRRKDDRDTIVPKTTP